MQKSPLITLGLCLSLGLTQIALPASALARSEGTPATRARIVSNAPLPIGSLNSAGLVAINGRVTSGHQTVWNGELIQATAAPASVALTALGQINLKDGALVQVNKAGSLNQPTFVTSLYAGEAEITVAPAVNAYVEAGGKAWVASGATLLQLSVNNGQATVKTLRGSVSSLGDWSLYLGHLGHLTALSSPLSVDSASNLLRSLKELAPHSGARSLISAHAAMIGMIESAGTLKLNGRVARAQELLWNGELIQTTEAEARATLNQSGRVHLAKGTLARLTLSEASDKRTLMAQLLNGELTMRLAPNVSASVETQGKTFAAEPGAHFRLSEQAGQVTLEIKAGNVREIGREIINALMDVAPKSVNDEKAGEHEYQVRPADKGGYLRTVNPAATQTLRFLVTTRTGQVAAGVPVVFTLQAADEQPVGTLGVGAAAGQSFAARTDDKGMVEVPFNAGRAKGSTSITAVVAGKSEGHSSVVVVTDKDNGFWTKRNAVPVFAVVAGAVVAGIVVGLTREEPLPIQGRGGATIVP